MVSILRASGGGILGDLPEAGGGGGPYSQQFVDVNGGAFDYAASDDDFFELSVWINPKGTGRLLNVTNDTYVRIDGSDGNWLPGVYIRDVNNTFLLRHAWAVPIVQGTNQHMYVSFDRTTGAYVALLDGVDVTGSGTYFTPPTVGADPINLSRSPRFFTLNATGTFLDFPCEVSDLWFGNDQVVGYSSFHDGSGLPVDLSGVGNPVVYMPGTFSATEYNNGDNNGSATLNVTEAFFLDV